MTAMPATTYAAAPMTYAAPAASVTTMSAAAPMTTYAAPGMTYAAAAPVGAQGSIMSAAFNALDRN
eukprot:CAMPEP_0171268228 /NCGR_PEP_ID=MMETSP0790-20130122/59565_1 /TAXON_ID=2925 /ORGANISM="Alexandrium catenella, Strain OF101" /LENGTH=65 /DNA_ID=CAMNT_0011736987 /DNA_START=15 /DNA_END=209 /DNA_ORIENTATION=+